MAKLIFKRPDEVINKKSYKLVKAEYKYMFYGSAILNIILGILWIKTLF